MPERASLRRGAVTWGREGGRRRSGPAEPPGKTRTIFVCAVSFHVGIGAEKQRAC